MTSAPPLLLPVWEGACSTIANAVSSVGGKVCPEELAPTRALREVWETDGCSCLSIMVSWELLQPLRVEILPHLCFRY